LSPLSAPSGTLSERFEPTGTIKTENASDVDDSDVGDEGDEGDSR
jgi:hypothetical protein